MNCSNSNSGQFIKILIDWLFGEIWWSAIVSLGYLQLYTGGFCFKKGHSVHETSEEGESLLSLACSAGYFKLAQILLAMRANVEDRGIKVWHFSLPPLSLFFSLSDFLSLRICLFVSRFCVLMYTITNIFALPQGDCTPLMEAASGGYNDIVKLLMEHGADLNAQSSSGKY